MESLFEYKCYKLDYAKLSEKVSVFKKYSTCSFKVLGRQTTDIVNIINVVPVSLLLTLSSY